MDEKTVTVEIRLNSDNVNTSLLQTDGNTLRAFIDWTKKLVQYMCKEVKAGMPDDLDHIKKLSMQNPHWFVGKWNRSDLAMRILYWYDPQNPLAIFVDQLYIKNSENYNSEGEYVEKFLHIARQDVVLPVHENIYGKKQLNSTYIQELGIKKNTIEKVVVNIREVRRGKATIFTKEDKMCDYSLTPINRLWQNGLNISDETIANMSTIGIKTVGDMFSNWSSIDKLSLGADRNALIKSAFLNKIGPVVLSPDDPGKKPVKLPTWAKNGTRIELLCPEKVGIKGSNPYNPNCRGNIIKLHPSTETLEVILDFIGVVSINYSDVSSYLKERGNGEKIYSQTKNGYWSFKTNFAFEGVIGRISCRASAKDYRCLPSEAAAIAQTKVQELLGSSHKNPTSPFPVQGKPWTPPTPAQPATPAPTPTTATPDLTIEQLEEQIAALNQLLTRKKKIQEYEAELAALKAKYADIL